MTDKPNGEALAKQDPMQVDKKKKTYIAVVLDSSSSMQAIKKEVIAGFNEHAATIRAGSGNQMDSKVCLMTFASYVNPPLLWCENANNLNDLTEENYRPEGMTAMLDCVGATIDKLEKQEDIEDEQTAVLVLVVSDGQENNSKRETYPSISERVQRLTKTGRWTFVYLGSNQDLSKIQQDLNIPRGNTQTFVNTPAGYAQAFTQTNRGLSNYMTSRQAGVTMSSDFYSGTEDPIEKPEGQSSVITDKPDPVTSAKTPVDDDPVDKFYQKTS